MDMLAMTILVHFGCYIVPLRHLHASHGPTCGTTLQPSHMGHTRPISSLVWTVHVPFYVPKPRTNLHMAITMRMVVRIFFRHRGPARAIVKCPLYAHRTHTKGTLCNLQWL
jgi:hypothetical protein